MSELLIGCGNQHFKKYWIDRQEFTSVTKIDHDPNCGADVLHDLNVVPWPLPDNEYDEAHAYEVLEHLGRQGDAKSFFETFYEIWRVLKPGGLLFASVPMWDELWTWGDPSHTRVINRGSIQFLSQEQYRIQVGKTAMTDFRHIWKGDFEIVDMKEGPGFVFVLRAIK